jgi:hypothetical protein
MFFKKTTKNLTGLRIDKKKVTYEMEKNESQRLEIPGT